MTVRIGARDAIARAVAVGELDAGVVDGVAAPSDPLRLPETGARVARLHRGAARGGRAARSPARRARPVRLEDLVDARWIDAPVICAPLDELAALARADGFRRRSPTRART